jgi:LuxR family transcriptional activator of conjugal transfer of Ti plasmids
MHRVFEEYLHRLLLAADKQQLREAMGGIAADFELHNFAYITIPRTVKQKLRAISNYPPDWVTRYQENHYERRDPVVSRARRLSTMFEWDPGLACRERNGIEQRFFGEAADFGIQYGLTIPIEEAGVVVAATTFATDRRRPAYTASVRRHSPVLQFAVYCFHAHVRQNLNRSHVAGNLSLTPRQQQCIDLCAIGKTCPDIAELLKLKPRTVTYHVQNAKIKLRARTIGQATASLIPAKKIW